MKHQKKHKPALWKQIKEGQTYKLGGVKSETNGETLKLSFKSIKRINPRTSMRAAEEAKYRKIVKDEMQVGRFCQSLFCRRKATQVHHKCGRIGKLLLYKPQWAYLCDICHHQVHIDPEWARSVGLLCEKGRWNDQSIVPKDYYDNR